MSELNNNARFVNVEDIKKGDLLDLEADVFADPTHDPAYVFDYVEVIGTERETAECIRIDTDYKSVGFPVGHKLKVVPK